MPRRQRRILVVEDNGDLAFGLRMNLEGEGFRVIVVGTLESAQNALEVEAHDLILLDLMLPDGNGLDLLTTLRERRQDVPVIILSAKGDEIDIVTGLRLGAVDYVTKPFSVAELLERIKVRFRATQRRDARVDIGDLTLDPYRRIATRAGRRVDLTDHEWRVLIVLIEEAGTAVSREELIKRAWGGDEVVTPRNIDFFISSLRKKIETDPAAPRVLLTKRGVGYLVAEAGITDS